MKDEHEQREPTALTRGVCPNLGRRTASRLGHQKAVWVLDGSDLPPQGRKSAGVARQYCGRLGKVANC